MVNEITCGPEDFARSIEALIGNIPPDCSEEVSKAVERSTRKGVKAVKGYASKGGIHKWSPEYVGGFSSHVTKGVVSTGEIGNKAKPGLVHLLEKGHATPTGRRTRSFPHMAPAFDDIQDAFVKDVSESVGRALGGS